jgi:putative ABC transport system permease protein
LSRKLLALAGLWIGLTLVVALLMLGLDVGDRLNREMRAFGANIRLLPTQASLDLTVGGYDLGRPQAPAYLEERDVERLTGTFWRNNLLGIAPRLWTAVRIADRDVPLLGVWLDREVAVPGGEPRITGARQVDAHWKVRGSWPAADGSANGARAACLVGAALADDLGVRVGAPLEARGRAGALPLRVSGIVETGGREDRAILVDLRVAQRVAGLPGKISEVDVSALTTPENDLAARYHTDPAGLTPEEYDRWVCTPYPGSVASSLQEAVPGSTARVVRRVAETQGAILNRIEGVMWLLAACTFTACCLGVAGVLSAAILERRTEVALMQALGAHRGAVLRMMLAESGLLGAAGGLLAAGTGAWLGNWLMQVVFDGRAAAHGALLLVAPLLGVLLAWAATAGPVWRALGRETADVLRGVRG